MSIVNFPGIAESYDSAALADGGHRKPDVGFFAILDAMVRELAAADTVNGVSPGAAGESLVSNGAAWVSGRPGIVGCQLYHSAVLQVNSGALLLQSFDSEVFDTNGFHDPATNNSRVTIPVGYGGRYLVVLEARRQSAVSDGTYLYSHVRKNASGTNTKDASATAASTGQQTFLAVWLMALADSDYFEVFWQTNQASNTDVRLDNVAGGLTVLRIGDS